MQDSSINIVQKGMQRETSNTKPEVQGVKTYEIMKKLFWCDNISFFFFFLSLY